MACSGFKASRTKRGNAFLNQHGQGWREALNKKEKQMTFDEWWLTTDFQTGTHGWHEIAKAAWEGSRAATLEEAVNGCEAIINDENVALTDEGPKCVAYIRKLAVDGSSEGDKGE